VIGVDPGLSITGFGILDYKGGQIRTVAFGTIKPPVKESLANRLEYLNSHMTELLEKFEPNDFAIEDTFFSQNVKSALLLGQARGVLLLAAASKGIPTMDYSPRKVKQSVVGNGAADKKTSSVYGATNIRNERTAKAIRRFGCTGDRTLSH